MTDIAILVASGGELGDCQLESRIDSADASTYTFTVTNVSTLVKLTNITLYVFFDFTNLNMTVNGQTVGPLSIGQIPDLLPFASYEVTVDVVANVGTSPSDPAATPPAQYVLTTTATFDVDPMIPSQPDPTWPLAGGLLLYSVVSD